jgi:GT2 family glycosyltransferase
MKKIAIIIISYNRPADMLALAKNISLLTNTADLLDEVIIVNNKSTESYKPLVEFIAAHPEIPFKYIEAHENLGVSRGRNFAIQQSKAPVLVLIDDDAEFKDTDVLSRIQHAMALNPTAGVIAMKVLYYQNGQIQQTAFPHKSFNERKALSEFETYYFAGCGNIIMRDAFEKAGPFPTDFFYGMEEYDLSYRILDAGYTINYTADIVLLHKESPEGRQTKSEKLKGMWVNKSKVAWRYLPIMYFFTTAFMWSLFFLIKSKFDLVGFVKGWAMIIEIPFKEKKCAVSNKTLAYLRQTEARLMY